MVYSIKHEIVRLKRRPYAGAIVVAIKFYIAEPQSIFSTSEATYKAFKTIPICLTTITFTKQTKN